MNNQVQRLNCISPSLTAFLNVARNIGKLHFLYYYVNQCKKWMNFANYVIAVQFIIFLIIPFYSLLIASSQRYVGPLSTPFCDVTNIRSNLSIFIQQSIMHHNVRSATVIFVKLTFKMNFFCKCRKSYVG